MSSISTQRALVDGSLVGPVTVHFENGLISAVDRNLASDEPVADGFLTAGLIDLQLNGAYGIDTVSATPSQWSELTAALVATGVTSFQPTFITADLADQIAGVHNAARARRTLDTAATGARILGVHLEGPFLSPLQSGMHPKSLLIEPSPEAVATLLADPEVPRTVTCITLAPELPGGLEAVKALTDAGIRVWIGHSDATSDVVTAAIDAGATGITHLFNAQRGLGHRETGVAGTALVDDRVVLGLIADLQHVAPAVCSIVFRSAPGRIALVTDAMAAMGMAPGTYELGGVEVSVDGVGGAPRRDTGVLAGSALQLDQAIRNVVSLGVDVAVALDAATRVPADALGRPDLGRLEVGAAADFVWWSDDLTVRAVWVRGIQVYSAS